MNSSIESESAGIDSATQGQVCWQDVRQQAQSLSALLRTRAEGQAASTQSACRAYAHLVEQLIRWTAAPDEAARVSERALLVATPEQLQDFGRLLRDKRNQAGFSRVKLARRAKLSDATIKFLETARHPPSRATLLRLVGVPELGLRWADTPGSFSANLPAGAEEVDPALSAAALHRFDPRLSLSLVLEGLLVLDELRTALSLIEITASGARRACALCGMRSEAWAVDAREAAKLSLRHYPRCVGPLAESLYQRHPVLAELAQQERRSLRTPTAAQLEAARHTTEPERFHGCRTRRQVAAQLACVAAQPLTPYRKGLSETWLWALALGPCPVEPTTETFTERRAQHLAHHGLDLSALSAQDAAWRQGIAVAASWLLDSAAQSPAGESVAEPSSSFIADSDKMPHAQA